MTYKIEGLARADFAHLFVMNDAELAEHNAAYGCFSARVERS